MNNADQHDRNGMNDMDAVSRAYRDARDGDGMAPPAGLDDAILAAAHRAIHAGPKLAGSSWTRRWTPQLAVAAVVLLSVSVVFVSIEERPELAPAPLQSIALKQNGALPAADAGLAEKKVIAAAPVLAQRDAADKGSRPAPVDAAAGARTTPATPREQEADARSARRVASPPPVSSSGPAPASSLAAAGTQAYAPPVNAPAPAPAIAAPQALTQGNSPGAGAAPSAFPATRSEAFAVAPKKEKGDARVAAAESARAEENTAATGSLRRKDAADALTIPAVPAPASPPSTAASAVPVAPIGYAPSPLVKQVAPAATASAAGVTVGGATAPSPATSPATAGKTRLNEATTSVAPVADEARPGPWLKRLLELREQGNYKQLREELPRFRKAHPDVVLPKSLTDLPPE